MIVKLVLKYKFEIILFLLITAIYFLFRLPHLTLQPIFADEAIYVRWAQVMRSEATLRFLPLSDGKTPLYMWILMPVFKLIKDPLLAGRLLSVFSGYLTLLGALFLGWRSFGKRTGLFAAFLIAITPYEVFFDRMALVDPMLAAFSIWSLNLALMLTKYLRLDLAMGLGYLIGGAMLTKTPGSSNLFLLPITLIAVPWKKHQITKTLVRLCLLWVVTFIIAMGMYNILRLGPGFDNLSSRNQDYIFSPLRLIHYPLDPLIPHLKDLADWLPKLLTIPILILVLVGLILPLILRLRIGITIMLWALLPLIVELLLIKTFTARYILFSIPPLLVLAAYVMDYLLIKINRRIVWTTIFMLVIIFLLPAKFNLTLLQDPSLVPLPNEERRGYLEDWTAGYGFPEIAQYLSEQAKKNPIVVGTEGRFGTLPDGLWIYLDKTPNISFVPGEGSLSAQIKQASFEHPTYFVANKNRFSPNGATIKLIKEYPKPIGKDIPPDSIILLQILPTATNSSTIRKP